MKKRYFDFRDIFQVIRYGFSGRKIAVHFIGLVLAYLIYETLVYLSLVAVGGHRRTGLLEQIRTPTDTALRGCWTRTDN